MLTRILSRASHFGEQLIDTLGPAPAEHRDPPGQIFTDATKPEAQIRRRRFVPEREPAERWKALLELLEGQRA